MKFSFIKIYGGIIWGMHKLSKEQFVNCVQRGETIIDLEEMTVFNPDTNAWESIKGDEE